MSTPSIVLVGPPLEEAEVNSLRERLLATGLAVDLALAPKDANQTPGWRGLAEPKLAAASRIIVIEPSAGRDPEGRYRRELATLFARLSPEARARCIPCRFDSAADSGLGGELRPVLAGPRGRPVGDLTQDQTLAALPGLLAVAVPRATPVAATAMSPAVLSDHPVETDGIGLQRAVDAFVELITAPSTKPPIVASVEGSWGVGKSSFLNLLRREIRRRGWQKLAKAAEERDPPGLRTVWFNAWSSDGELTTFSSFALSLIAELENVHFLRRMVLRFQLAIQRFNWASGWQDLGRFLGGLVLLLAALVATLIGALKWGWLEAQLHHHAHWAQALTTGGTAALAIGGLQRLRSFFASPISGALTKHIVAPDYEAKRAQRDQLYDDIAKIIDVYTRGADRLYVFIDDLDRADPAKVAELTQTIGVILAKAGTKLVYVLAIDREKVAAALAAKHKEVAGLVASVGLKGGQPLDFGQAFLEKLIQLPFRVPAPSADDMRSWIQRMELPTTGLGDVVRMIAPFLGVNPRRLKQFVNLLHLRLRLLEGGSAKAKGAKTELSLFQLGKLTALELLYPFFIGDLVVNPALVNALLIGAGPEVDSNAYRRWSAITELLELLAVTLPPRSGTDKPIEPAELLSLDRNTSLLDLDIGPLLRVGLRPVEALNAPPAPAELAAPALDKPSGYSTPAALALYRYAREYERIRATEGGSTARTMKLDRLFDDMTRVRGLSDVEACRFFDTGTSGHRIAALASCLSEQHPSTGELLRRTLEQPAARFETYHALRIAKLLWNKLALPDQESLARIVANRWLNNADVTDGGIWSMTEDVLRLVESVALGNDFQVTFPEGIAIRLVLAEYADFNTLTDRLYFRLRGRVDAYQYGTQWHLVDDRGVSLQHARQLSGNGPGSKVADPRPLSALGITAGSRLQLRLLHS